MFLFDELNIVFHIFNGDVEVGSAQYFETNRELKYFKGMLQGETVLQGKTFSIYNCLLSEQFHKYTPGEPLDLEKLIIEPRANVQEQYENVFRFAVVIDN